MSSEVIRHKVGVPAWQRCTDGTDLEQRIITGMKGIPYAEIVAPYVGISGSKHQTAGIRAEIYQNKG